MRIKFTRLIVLTVALANLIAIYYSLRLFVSFNQFQSPPTIKPTTKPPPKPISKLVTVIIREFELQDNDVSATVNSLLNLFPNIQVLVVYDVLPYPPLDTNITDSKNVKEINLSPQINVSFMYRFPVLHVKTKYVLFVPDAARILSRKSLQLMVAELQKEPETIVVASTNKKPLGCLRVNLNIKEWVLRFHNLKGNICDAVSGKHLLLMETEQLKQLPEPFMLPFPHALYVQTAPLLIKVKILKGLLFQEGPGLGRAHHAQWRYRQKDAKRLKKLYGTFQIKQVVRDGGTSEWYGCNRESSQCFEVVHDQLPSYLLEGKWTPPCCLSNLKKTALHVFSNLDASGIRYWLEAGSLLGAMRSGDVLPWDHDVDVGFNRDDLTRSPWLKKARDKPVIDSLGFLWEKASEGNFYRVHYSKSNQIHVNLYPFCSRNGTMMKDGWFTDRRSMEFPDKFLHPMSSIEFSGRLVPSPNNIRDFLELKFGKEAVDNPQYPNTRLPFP